MNAKLAAHLVDRLQVAYAKPDKLPAPLLPGRSALRLAQTLTAHAPALLLAAETVIGELPSEYERCTEQIELAVAYHQLDPEQARLRLQACATQVNQLNDRRQLALLALAHGWRRTQRFQIAETLLLKRIKGEYFLSNALCELALDLAQAGRWKKADELLAHITGAAERQRVIGALVRTAAVAGNNLAAHSYAARLPLPSQQVQAWRDIVAARVERGRIGAAEAAVKALPAAQQALVWPYFAQIVPDDGAAQRALRQAEAVITGLVSPYERAFGWSALALAGVQRRATTAPVWLAQAEAAALALPDPLFWAYPLKLLVQAYLAAADAARAERLLARLPLLRDQLTAGGWVAQWRVQHGAYAEALALYAGANFLTLWDFICSWPLASDTHPNLLAAALRGLSQQNPAFAVLAEVLSHAA